MTSDLKSEFDSIAELEENNCWVAQDKYKKLLEKLNKKSGNQNLKTLCKDKIKEMTKKIEEGLNSVETSIPISEEELKVKKQIVNACTDVKKSFSEIAKLIGTQFGLIQSVKSTEEIAKETMPLFTQICSGNVIDDQGNIIEEGNNGELAWIKQRYYSHQEYLLNFYLVPIFKKLISTKILTTRSFSKWLNEKGLSPNTLEFIKTGIKHFLKKDYLSSIHILVPQFEKLFLDTSKLVNKSAPVVTTRDQKGGGDIWTQTRTLSSDFLKHEEIKKVWGEDLCELIDFVLLDPLGYKIRHRLAHGELPLEDFNFKNAILIIFLYLAVLGRVKILKTESQKNRN